MTPSIHIAKPSVRLATFATIVLFAIACTTKKESPDSADTAAQAPRAQATPALSKDFEDPTYSAADFESDVKALDFSKGLGHDRPRKCKPGSGAECSSASDRTLLRIDPEEGAKELDPNALSSTGHAIAKIENKKKGADLTLKIPADAKDVYLVVTPGKSRLVWIDKGGKADKKVVLQRFTYIECEHPNDINQPREADFKTCPPINAADDSEIASVWISCLAGCCVSLPDSGKVRSIPQSKKGA